MLEEVRTKVVKLEAGRRERRDWYFILFDNFCNDLHLFVFRTNRSSTPSNTPVSVTQSLFDLRLVHTRFLEDHSSTSALSRQRETDIAELDRQQVEAQETISSLEHNLHTHQNQIVRRETRALLAEREVGFLQALLVGVFVLYGILFDHACFV